MTEFSIEQLNALALDSPHIALWSMQVEDASRAQKTLTMRMPWNPAGANSPGSRTWHGGPVAALLDTAGAFASGVVSGRLGGGTVGFNIDYVRPAIGDLTARAHVRKAGRRLNTVEVEIEGEDGKLCALGRGVFFVGE